ncbi:MAG: site-specific integrase [Alphaproteobacteria bacterium]
MTRKAQLGAADLVRLDAFLDAASAERGLALNSRLAYARDLKDFLRFLKKRRVALSKVEPDTVRAWLAAINKQGLSAASAARRLSALRQFFGFLVSEGDVSENPCAYVDGPRRRRPLPKTLSAADAEHSCSGGRGAGEGAEECVSSTARLLYGSGLRASRLVAVPLPPFPRPRSFLGQGQVERRALCHSAARAGLEFFLAARGATSDGAASGSCFRRAAAKDAARQPPRSRC